jgi:hypothetical protein
MKFPPEYVRIYIYDLTQKKVDGNLRKLRIPEIKANILTTMS